jgi:AraC family transcriptional regulator
MINLPPPRLEDAPGMLMAGIRRGHRFTSAPQTVPAQWRALRDAGALPGRVGEATYGVICSGDAEGFEYLAGMEVVSFDQLPEGIGRMRIPPQRYAVFTWDGPASALGEVWEAIWAWLPASGYADAHTPAFERYDRRFDPATQRGITEVWFPVTARPTAIPDRRARGDRGGRSIRQL